jgi:aryl-alcohol dehydrogenase-like predicted oxidoreductase
MEKRRLGRTGHESSVVAFGSAALKRCDQETADRAIEFALGAGVNHFDVAPSYGEAELRLGPWMPKIRDRIFLGCKTTIRNKDEAWAELQRSLERLQTDHLDLYQLHSVKRLDDLDACTAKGGSLEALVRARDEGIVTWLGITGHTHDAPATHYEALQRFDFDTVMLPLNFVLYTIPQYRHDFERLVDLCQQRDVGIHIIKSAAKDPWGERERVYDTWYEPFDDQPHLDQAIAFVLSQPITTLCSAGDTRIMPKVVQAAARYQKLSEPEQEALLATAGEFHTPFVGRWA